MVQLDVFFTLSLIQHLVDTLRGINIRRSEAQYLTMLVHRFEFWVREANKLKGRNGELEVTGRCFLCLLYTSDAADE